MKFSKIKYIVIVFALLIISSPVLAHESRTYKIGENFYGFVVGSLGEPVVVDDKTGLDFSITKNNEPLVGAERLLKVEITSHNISKTFELSTVYGVDGKYKTTFFITKPNSLKYRVFGNLEGMTIDFTFECSKAGHVMNAKDDTTEVKVSEKITRTLQKGSFGCPKPKSDFEFPYSTQDKIKTGILLKTALALGILGIVLSLFVLFKNRKYSDKINLMETNKNNAWIIIVVLLVGGILGYYFGNSKADSGTHKMPDGTVMSNESMNMASMMADMNKALMGKTGDDFDKAFLTEMIVHHEGAVEMAKLALKNAKHKEIVDLSNAIISAQNKEIGDMTTWFKNWYEI